MTQTEYQATIAMSAPEDLPLNDIAARLRRYRPRDEFGDPVKHTICDEAAAEIERLRTPAPADHLVPPQDISTAPPMTDVLVWWPIVKLDQDGEATDEIVDGCWIISEDQGGYWIEPEVMNAIGDHMGDDHTYADMPSHWMPLPAPLFTATSEASTDA